MKGLLQYFSRSRGGWERTSGPPSLFALPLCGAAARESNIGREDSVIRSGRDFVDRDQLRYDTPKLSGKLTERARGRE